MEDDKTLREIRKIALQNRAMLKSIKRSMRLNSIFGMIKLAIFIVPLILAAIYLPPIIQEYLGLLESVRSGSVINDALPQGINIGELQGLIQNITP